MTEDSDAPPDEDESPETVPDESGERRHRFSAGQGFDEPYEGFDLEPPELDVDPSEVDPVDSRVVADLLDSGQFPTDDVDVDELIDVGLSYMGINRFEQAADAFERAARFAPEGSRAEQEAWVNKGAAHAQMEEWDAAAGAYEEALFIDEDGEFAAEAHTNLAYALWESGETQTAYQHAEDAVRQDERLPHAWYNLGFIEAEQGRYEAALDCLEKAERLGFRSVELFEEKQRTLEELGREEEAEAAAEQAAAARERREDELVG
ncbi:MAG: tetratricopeptide repeat protein [Halobacteriaceae archaeon]